MNTTTSPVTLKDVAHRVEQTLGQPIAPDVLQAIAKTCRDDFLVALDQCEQGKPNAPKVNANSKTPVRLRRRKCMDRYPSCRCPAIGAVLKLVSEPAVSKRS